MTQIAFFLFFLANLAADPPCAHEYPGSSQGPQQQHCRLGQGAQVLCLAVIDKSGLIQPVKSSSFIKELLHLMYKGAHEFQIGEGSSVRRFFQFSDFLQLYHQRMRYKG